jgi:hypothetical protein
VSIYVKPILWFDRHVVLACDGNCGKAWGINGRPRIDFDPGEPDDYAYLADGELGNAPLNPAHGKAVTASQAIRAG